MKGENKNSSKADSKSASKASRSDEPTLNPSTKKSFPKSPFCQIHNEGTDDSPQLPDTVTKLTANNGCKVFLIGTAHFSQKSQDDVSQVIRKVKPEVLMVELCKSRSSILYLDEETIQKESEDMNIRKIVQIFQRHGAIQGAVYCILLTASSQITKDLGMAPGGEFRAAIKEMRQSAPNCHIQLGDRPIEVTLSRAFRSLSLWQKMSIAWHILTSKDSIRKEDVERCKQRDILEEMLAEMTGEFPGMAEVFVNERDTYLAWSLQLATQLGANHGNTPRVIVGVVGIGHVNGIVKQWGKVEDKDIVRIMTVPRTSLCYRLCKLTVRCSIYGLLAFTIYKCYRRFV